MKRRHLVRAAAVTSAGALAGLGGLLQFSYVARGATAGSNKTGGWSALAAWPLIPLHAVLLGDGRVLTYGTDGSGKQTGYFIYDIWNPGYNAADPGSSPQEPNLSSGSHLTLPNGTGTDVFCSAQLVLPQSGNVLLAGGDNWTGTSTTNTGNNNSNIFSPGDNTLAGSKDSAGNFVNMNRPRWYASPTTLPDGRTYIQGGLGGHDYPEVRDSAGNFRLLTGVPTSSLFRYYPRNFIAPNGQIFGYSDRTMYYVDPNAQNGQGSLRNVGAMPSTGPSGWTSTDVMFAPGRILRTGGGSTALPEEGGSQTPGKNAAAVIDINGATPTYKKMPSMPVSLHWASATVLADGNVVVTGGSQTDNQLVGVNTQALIWKAGTGGWTRGAQGSGRARLYHSIALLLPDGSVLVAGGGAPGPQTNRNAEIYYPYYLFDSAGGFAPRPRITGISTNSPSWGGTFTLSAASAAAIQRVTLVRTGSVTHSCNFEQRFMELPFTPTAGGGLSVKAPANRNLAPPGRYLLFAIDNRGVPSVARIVQFSP